VFEPVWGDDQRQAQRARWSQAVNRSRGWVA